MNWKERIEELNNDLVSLKEKAVRFIGSDDFGLITKCSKQSPIEKYLEGKNLQAHPVATEGVRCIILSSALYPEVGILLFDAPSVHQSNQSKITIGSATFFQVCGCCHPYCIGVSEDSKDSDTLRQQFIFAIRQACEKNKITKLFFTCFDENLNMKQDYNNLHLLRFRNLQDEEIDRWRFASAFKDISIDDIVFPFEKIFQSTNNS